MSAVPWVQIQCTAMHHKRAKMVEDESSKAALSANSPSKGAPAAGNRADDVAWRNVSITKLAVMV